MEISYGQGSCDRFDWYTPPGTPAHDAPLVVFVHGGAWRSEDKANHASLARTLARLTGWPVALPNYRLTSPQNPIQHPAHASDVLRFLHFLVTWPGPTSSGRPPSRLYLLGHSCGAHILTSIFLASPFAELLPSQQLLAATRAVVLSEGIYDIDVLLRSFPSYKEWFIANAFGDHAAYPDVNAASYPARAGGEHLRWLILHSKGDVLVDQLQSETIYAHLSAIAADLPSDKPRPLVEKNFEEMNENHNDLLAGDVYPRIVAGFVVADATPPLKQA